MNARARTKDSDLRAESIWIWILMFAILSFTSRRHPVLRGVEFVAILLLLAGAIHFQLKDEHKSDVKASNVS